MEKIKALMAVALFIAAILFLNYENEGRQGLPARHNPEKEQLPGVNTDTLVLK